MSQFHDLFDEPLTFSLVWNWQAPYLTVMSGINYINQKQIEVDLFTKQLQSAIDGTDNFKGNKNVKAVQLENIKNEFEGYLSRFESLKKNQIECGVKEYFDSGKKDTRTNVYTTTLAHKKTFKGKS